MIMVNAACAQIMGAWCKFWIEGSQGEDSMELAPEHIDLQWLSK